MEIFVVILVLVLFVSILDYALAKRWQEVTSDLRNAIVFEKRNKAYGAYQIRSSYNRTMMLILLGVVFTFGASYGAYLLSRNWELENAVFSDDEQIIIELPPIDDEKIVEIPETQIEDEKIIEKQVASQIDFRLFQITDTPVASGIKTQDDVGSNMVGTSNVIVDDDEGNFAPPTNTTSTIIEPKKEEDPITIVDIDAEFPGGFSSMVTFLSRNLVYPEDAVRAGIEGKATIRFVVEKDGSIGNIAVQRGVPNCPDCDKEAVRVIKKMPKWKPGEINGKIVRSYYSLPISFKLQPN